MSLSSSRATESATTTSSLRPKLKSHWLSFISEHSHHKMPPLWWPTLMVLFIAVVISSIATPTWCLAGTEATQTELPVQKQSHRRSSPTSSGGGNRWTHFGARLRPLTAVAATTAQNGRVDDHQEAASNSKSSGSAAIIVPMAASRVGFNKRAQQQVSNHVVGNNAKGTTMATTMATLTNGKNQEADDEDDDDQDNEALLYKMMQQQNFLMNPNFQEQQSPSSNKQANKRLVTGQQQSATMAGRQQQQTGQNNNEVNDENDLFNNNNSKKVIKLLKSYSHIHQVDDSDDQIRGTNTRVSAFRAPQQQQNQARQTTRSNQYSVSPVSGGNGGRQANNGRQHIFVSSRPVTTSQTRASAARVAYPAQQQFAGQATRARSTNYDPSNSAGSGQRSSPPDVGESNEQSGGGADQAGDSAEAEECPDGIFADVASGCSGYYVCQSGSQVQERFDCPLGTLFNDIILTCDFAHNVQCGKRPGEPSPGNGYSAAPVASKPQQNDAPQAYARQPSQQHQQQAPLARQQQHQHQHQQPQLPRPSQGPRQLVIGNPYNRHNQRVSPVLQSYPAVRPLSNALASGNSAASDEGDSDDNEPTEPLVPATLPPLRASTAATSTSRLPYKAPPSAPPAATFAPPTSIQGQIPHQARRQSGHYSQYPQPRQQQQLANFPSRSNNYQAQASTTTEASVGTSGASATTPVFAEPTVSSLAAQQQQGGSHTSDDGQSFSLVINHLTPVRGPAQQQQQPLVRQQQANVAGYQLQTQERFHPQVDAPAINKQQTSESPAPIHTSNHIKLEASPLASQQHQPNQLIASSQPTIAHQQQQQQQLLQVSRQLATTTNSVPATNPPRSAARSTYGKLQQQQQLPTTSLHQRQSHLIEEQPLARHESRREPSHRQQHYQQSQRMRQHKSIASPPSPGSKIDGLVDLTNGQAVSNEAALNDGMLLIVRHASGAQPLQFSSSAPAPANANANSHSSGQDTGRAFAVDPKLVRPDSAIDSQLFPNVQKFVADQHSQHATQETTLRASQQAPPQHHHQTQQQSRPQQFQQVAGVLPPMSPPPPPPGDSSSSSSDGTTDQLASSASAASRTRSLTTESRSLPVTVAAGAASSVERLMSSPAAAVQQQKQQQPAASNKTITTSNQPAARVKRTKRIKAVQSPATPKGGAAERQLNNQSSTTSNTATPLASSSTAAAAAATAATTTTTTTTPKTLTSVSASTSTSTTTTTTTALASKAGSQHANNEKKRHQQARAEG